MNPNIIVIFADDMGYGDLACQNPESRIPTPHLDRLASQGIRFLDAHASSAVCTPSRYSLLTGRYCWRSRLNQGVLWGYSQPLIDENRMTVASLLKSQGYRTGCVGKWHLGWTWQLTEGDVPAPDEIDAKNIDFSKPISRGPTTVGFDSYFGISASLDMAPYCYIRDDQVTTVPRGWIEASPYDAYWRAGPISSDFQHEQVLPRLTDEALQFIRTADCNSPFFLYFPLNGPHTPIVPTPEFQGRSQAGGYGDFVAQCDDTVGRIMDALEETGQAENTLLIFTSDNGAERIAYQRALDTGHYSMGPLRGLKRDAWEGGHRIPFVARWPERIEAGTICEQTICLSDLLATAADVTQTNLPEDAGEDSCSFYALLTGGTHRSEREALVHHSCNGKFGIRKENWVFIDASTGDDNGAGGEPQWLKEKRGYGTHEHPGELFDLREDLEERRNLYAQHPEKVAELKTLLEKIKHEGRSVYRT